MEIEERIDVEALLKSIGSLQDLQFRQRGLEPAMQQVVDAAKTLFKADGADAAAVPVDQGAAVPAPDGVKVGHLGPLLPSTSNDVSTGTDSLPGSP